MSASQRNKGARGEREAAALFKAHGWAMARRRSTGEESQVNQGRDLAGVEPYCVQVHFGDHPNPIKKLSEAEKAAGEHEIPAAFCRKTNGKWTVTISAETFFRLAGYP